MLKDRLLVLIPLIPAAVALVAIGGWIYTLVVALILGLAALEYWRIFIKGGNNPSAIILVGGSFLLPITRMINGFQYSDAILVFIIMVSMFVHLIEFEKGSQTAVFDFVITLGGIMYIGWLGSYLVSIRNLPDGLWWLMLTLPAIWIADGGAYTIGRHFGKHKISKRASPNKSWEGFFGGIITSLFFTPLFALLWQVNAPSITPFKGFVLGGIIASLSIIGDLGESMIKRQFNVKDSSNLIPGHGGVFDRIDSWLWAVPIGYYLAVLWK